MDVIVATGGCRGVMPPIASLPLGMCWAPYGHAGGATVVTSHRALLLIVQALRVKV